MMSAEQSEPPPSQTSRIGRSTLLLGAGLGVTGLGTLLTMAIGARALPSREYGAFVTWWALATFCGTIFAVFEIYVARHVVTAVGEGRAFQPSVATLSGSAWLVAAGTSGALLVSSLWLAHHVFDGNIAATLLLPVFVSLAMLQCLQRGVGIGRGTFGGNASQGMTDGILRALFAGLVALSGKHSMNWFAAAACASSACSLLVVHRVVPVWVRPRLSGTRVHWMPLMQLSTGIISAMLLLNGSIVWLSASSSVSTYTLGAFAGAITLSQVPAQFASAVASTALSNLSIAIDSGKFDDFRRLRNKMLRWCAVGGGLFVAAFALFGQLALSIYLGSNYQLPRVDLIVLGVTSMVMLLALVQQAALSAQRQWRQISVSWGLGCLGFTATFFLPFEPLTRALLAPLLAALIVLVTMAVVQATENRKWSRETLG